MNLTPTEILPCGSGATLASDETGSGAPQRHEGPSTQRTSMVVLVVSFLGFGLVA